MDSFRSYLIIGLIAGIVGLAAGLGYAWFVAPVEYTDVTPAELRPEYRSTWITLVAASYTVENDWGRAKFRLESLGEGDNIGPSVAAVLRDAVAELQPRPVLRALARLADRLGQRTPEMIIYLATPLLTITPMPVQVSATPTSVLTLTPSVTPSPTPTFAPPATPSPLPTLTPTPSPTPGYVRVEQNRLCEVGASTSQIRVTVEDGEGKGIPGVEVWISWEGGADRFVTGLKPERGAGYGDLDMEPGIVYDVSVGASAVPLARGLKAEVCPSSVPTQTAQAMWLLTFRTIPPTPTPPPTSTPTPTLTPIPTS